MRKQLMRSLVQRSVLLFILSVVCSTVSPAQLRFYASQPNIDSFPVVRIGVGVTVSGIAATDLTTSNFSVTSDGTPASGLQLVDCDAPLNAAIAIVVDTSASMKQSVGTGRGPNYSYAAFRESFSHLVDRVPKGSLFTVVPFGDSASYCYPRSTPYFYNSGVDPDTTELLSDLRSLRFDSAGTYVDAGILYATQLLRSVTVGRRAIVLVTDDYIDEETTIAQLLQRNSISLYVMQVHPDSGIQILPNKDVAEATAGGYFEAPDTLSYSTIMSVIADRIFSTRCTLRYVDNTPCPWLKAHDVVVGLHYKNADQSVNLQYALGPNTLDTTLPTLCTDSSHAYVRTAVASKNYPCSCALKDGTASALQNFKAGKPVVHLDSLWVPLTVIDTLYPADGDVTVIDVNGNESKIHVHYSPKPDTVAPQFDPVLYTGGAYQVGVREARPWDRGIQSLQLDAGASNIVLDLLKYYKKDSGWMVLHIHDLTKPVDGCLIAIDSAGNVSRLCLAYTPNAPDTLPPQLSADAMSEPRTSISGSVTENRPNDTGIKDVLVSPGSNTTNGSQTIITGRQTRVSARIIDSLYRAVLYIRATDSANNEMHDSLVYQPQPDIAAPVVQYSVAGKVVQVTATEVASWDRGLQSVTIGPNTGNISLTNSAYTDARHWNGTLTITDRTLNAWFTVIATDSAQNTTTQTINIPGSPVEPPAYMGDSVIDFGTHRLPVLMRKSIVIRNSNAFAMTVNIPGSVGDDSVFSMVEPNLFPLSAHNAEELNFDWQPHSAGHWKTVYTLYSGTDKIGTITLLGVSIGDFTLAADTVAALSGTIGSNLHVYIATEPTALNVDTIRFKVHYDPNVVEFFGPSNCTGSSSLCGYNFTAVKEAIDGSHSDLAIALTRQPSRAAVVFDRTNAILTLPLQTYVSSVDSTPVWFSDIYTSAGGVSDTLPGLVRSLDTCGTPEMRQFLRAERIDILGVSPNPSNGRITARIHSATAVNARVAWVDLTGRTVSSNSLVLAQGIHDYTIPGVPGSGSYDLVVTLADGSQRMSESASAWRVQVVR